MSLHGDVLLFCSKLKGSLAYLKSALCLNILNPSLLYIKKKTSSRKMRGIIKYQMISTFPIYPWNDRKNKELKIKNGINISRKCSWKSIHITCHINKFHEKEIKYMYIGHFLKLKTNVRIITKDFWQFEIVYFTVV